MEPNGTRGSVIIGDSKRQTLSDQEEQLAVSIIDGIMSTLGKIQQYPITNEIVAEKLNETHALLSKWLRTYSRFECVTVQSNLQVNNAILPLPMQEKDFIKAFVFYMTERNVRTFEILAGIKLEELQKFFEFFSKPSKEVVSNKNISRSLKRMGIKHAGLSSEMVMEGIVIKTQISNELERKLASLDIDELVEKANVISQLDMDSLHKVTGLATMVTNLSYTQNEKVSGQILKKLAQTLHGTDIDSRLSSARQFSQIAEKAVDYTLYNLHRDVGDMMADQLAQEEDPQVFSALAQGLEKSAQIHIVKGDYDKAMNIIESFDRETKPENLRVPTLIRQSEASIEKIANPTVVKKLVTKLESSDRKAQNTSINMLSKMGKNAVSELIDVIYLTEEQKVQDNAVKVLTNIGKPALSEIYSELKEEMAPKFRIAFLKVLGDAGDIHSLKKIIPFMVSEDEAISEESFRSMLKIGGPGAEQKVLDDLANLNFPLEFFKNRVMDFGSCKNQTMVKPLIEYLGGKGPFAQYVSPDIKIETINSLGRLGGPDSVKALGRVLTVKKGFLGLGKGDEVLEVTACNALRRIGDTTAEKSLKKATKSKLKKVQIAAETALKAIKLEKQKEEPSEEKAGETSMETPDSEDAATTMEMPDGKEGDTFMEAPGTEEAATSEEIPGEMDDTFEEAPFEESTKPADLEEKGDFEFAFDDSYKSPDEGLKPDEVMEDLDDIQLDFPSDDQKPADDFSDDEGGTTMETPFTDSTTLVDKDESDDLDASFESGDFQPDDGDALLKDSGSIGIPVRIVLTVGPVQVDNVRIVVPGIDEQGKVTENQHGAEFSLPLGKSIILIMDQGMKVEKEIEVFEGEDEIKIDLQSIFNF